LQPIADPIDGANLVTRLRERCDAGHRNDVMRVTKGALSRADRLSGDWARSDLARPVAASSPAAQ